MKRKILNSLMTTLTATALVGSQVLNVSAAPIVKAENSEKVSDYYAENFDLESYKAAYPDLREAFEGDNDAYLNHYINYGVSEGRTDGTFDGVAVLLNNYDYIMEHGLDKEFPFFDVEAYRAMYPDLEEAFGDDLSQYLNHYLNFGIFENRTSGSEIDLIAMANKYPNIDIKSNVDLSDENVVNEIRYKIGKLTNKPSVNKSYSARNFEEKTIERVVEIYKEYFGENSIPDVEDIIKDEEIIVEEDNVLYNEFAYNLAHDLWEASEPVEESYVDVASFEAAYANWEAKQPVREEYIVGYTTEEASYSAYETDHATWESNTPKQSDYLNQELYEAALAEHNTLEPNSSSYTYYEDWYNSEELAYEAYEDALETWEENKPKPETEEEYLEHMLAVKDNLPDISDYLMVSTFDNFMDLFEEYRMGYDEYKRDILLEYEENLAVMQTELESLEKGTEEYYEAYDEYLMYQDEYEIMKERVPVIEDYILISGEYNDVQEALDAYIEAYKFSCDEMGALVTETMYIFDIDESVSYDFVSDHEQWVEEEPVLEDFPVEEYPIEDNQEEIADNTTNTSDTVTEDESEEPKVEDTVSEITE